MKVVETEEWVEELDTSHQEEDTPHLESCQCKKCRPEDENGRRIQPLTWPFGISREGKRITAFQSHTNGFRAGTIGALQRYCTNNLKTQPGDRVTWTNKEYLALWVAEKTFEKPCKGCGSEPHHPMCDQKATTRGLTSDGEEYTVEPAAQIGSVKYTRDYIENLNCAGVQEIKDRVNRMNASATILPWRIDTHTTGRFAVIVNAKGETLAHVPSLMLAQFICVCVNRSQPLEQLATLFWGLHVQGKTGIGYGLVDALFKELGKVDPT